MGNIFKTTFLKKKRKIILISCILSMFMASVEVTIVSTAMPNIITELGDFSFLSLVFSIYLSMQAITIPICGYISDLFGRKIIFLIGNGLFLIGSVLCGYSSNMIELIFFRAIQGIGAGAIIPLSTIIIADIYSQKERTKLQSYLSGIWAVSAILGPLLGTFIVKKYHWSGIFWINIPIGIISMILSFCYLPTLSCKKKISTVDIIGTSYLTISIGTFSMALFQEKFFSNWNIFLLTTFFISSVLFFKEQKYSVSPLFPSLLWKNKVFIASNLGSLLISAAMMSISVFLPIYIQLILGKSMLEAGWTLSIMSIGWPLSSFFCGKFMIHTSYKFMAFLGTVFLLIGIFFLVFLDITKNIKYAILASFIVGMGMGISNTTFLVSVQNEVPFSMRGISTASTIFSRILGSALGTSLLGSILNLNLKLRIPYIKDPLQYLMNNENYIEQELTNIVQQISASIWWVYFFSFLIAFCSFFSVSLIPKGLKPKE